MNISFRSYANIAGITDDYHKIRDFLIRLRYSEFTYARWDWMITHSYLDRTAISKIGVWEESNYIVGIATFDCRLGKAFCLTLPKYDFLKKEMLVYSEDKLSNKGEFGVVISDNDPRFQAVASKLGFYATPEKENDSIFYLDNAVMDYRLPEGFYITDMRETYDPYQYLRVLWKGFNHELDGEGELKYSSKEEQLVKEEMIRPNVDLKLKIAVVSPDGNFVSYCGMWYDPKVGYAVIEPVATDPQYRNMGLGRAAVLEGIKRIGELGAKTAIVGSSQQFYYSIGLRPFKTSTIWRKKLY